MNKKIILSIVAAIAVVGGVAAMSAYEAHVINVTAHIENALEVNTTPIEFGTVFPQEYLEKSFIMKLSSSFLAENRVDDVTYVIKQKPMPKGDRNAKVIVCNEEEDFKEYVVYAYCHDFSAEDPGYTWVNDGCTDTEINYYDYCYLSLCPFLSKTDGDLEDNNDTAHVSYYNDPTPSQPNSGDEYCEASIINAFGRLAKSEKDISDTWIVDLKVPPIKGFIGQDWPGSCPFVKEDSQSYGCELWIEVTGISLPPTICTEKPDVMLVLDRSGSISSPEMIILQNAAKGFATALSPSADGAHMGQTSFADIGTLDLHLTYDTTAINNAIDNLVPGGYTNLYEGILLANGELADGVHDRLDSESPDYMVIITDGEPNRPLTGDPRDLAKAQADAADSAGTIIYVVGVGVTPANAEWLKNNIATSPAHYFGAGDWSQLKAILEDIASCEENGVVSGPWINEIHYDNISTDTDEGVEIAGPAGTDLTGWTVVFYSGFNGQSYSTLNLSGAIPNQQGGFGTLWFPWAPIQNGSPDGLALVSPTNVVIQFLSYEGIFVATDEPAISMTSVDIGVDEDPAPDVDYSLQLQGAGNEYADFMWYPPMPYTHNAVNIGQAFIPAP